MSGFPSTSRSRTLSLLLAASVALVLLASSDRADAQSASPAPDSDQYGPSTDASAADIPPALTRNTASGTDSVNEAVTAGSAPPSAAAQITSLPETGGAPLASLCAGVAFIGCALLLLRSSLRKS